MNKLDDNYLLNKYISNTGILKIFLQDMSKYIDLFSFDKGDFLINEGECSNYLYFLVSGNLKVFSHSTSGKVMSLSHFNSFEIIGETCSLWGNIPTASVQATTSGYCLAISMNYRDILLNDVTFLRFTCENLGKRLSSLTNNTCVILFDSLESRLASFILKTQKNGVFRCNLTECAEALCTSYRHLLRVINIFCNESRLTKLGKDYKILDMGYLNEIASNSYDLG